MKSSIENTLNEVLNQILNFHNRRKTKNDKSKKQIFKKNIMASVLARYYFSDYKIRDVAWAQLKEHFYNSEVKYFGYYIEIKSKCKNAQLASEICIANGGQQA